MAIRRFESNGRYSNVVEHNGVLYLTGQLCSNPAGDVKQQTKEILEKTEALLENTAVTNTIFFLHRFISKI